MHITGLLCTLAWLSSASAAVRYSKAGSYGEGDEYVPTPLLHLQCGCTVSEVKDPGRYIMPLGGRALSDCLSASTPHELDETDLKYRQ